MGVEKGSTPSSPRLPLNRTPAATAITSAVDAADSLSVKDPLIASTSASKLAGRKTNLLSPRWIKSSNAGYALPNIMGHTLTAVPYSSFLNASTSSSSSAAAAHHLNHSSTLLSSHLTSTPTTPTQHSPSTPPTSSAPISLSTSHNIILPPSLMGDRLFLFGGRDGEGIYSNTVLVFDAESHIWARMNTAGVAPAPRRGHSAVLVGMRIFIYGGCDDNHIFDDLFSLDTLTLRWDRIHHADLCNPRSTLPTETPCHRAISGPGPRKGHVSFAWDNRLYIHGGDNGKRVLSDAYVLPLDRLYGIRSTKENTLLKVVAPPWHKLKLLGDKPEGRAYHAAAVVGGIAVLQGGTDGDAVFSDFFSLDLRLTDSVVPATIEHAIGGASTCPLFPVSRGRPFGFFSRMNVSVSATGDGSALSEAKPVPVSSVARFGHAAAALGNFVVLVGGSDGSVGYAGDQVVTVNLLNLHVEVRRDVTLGGESRILDDDKRKMSSKSKEARLRLEDHQVPLKGGDDVDEKKESTEEEEGKASFQERKAIVSLLPRIHHAVAFIRSRGYLVGGFDGVEAKGDGMWTLSLGGSAFVPSIKVEFALQTLP
ncbi:Host cell factor 2 [Phlyctochytrium planicorne]|nr:Host cell factor 2 [Phlyctochytrium planicorne]